ncbi:MAG: GAF domain-containing protein [Fibrobacter sp.]|nr:GAF domain-containing protein [Fibrobacter sp.]
MINVRHSGQLTLHLVWIVPLILLSWMYPSDASFYYPAAMIFLVVLSSAIFVFTLRISGTAVNFLKLQGLAYLFYGVFVFFQLMSSGAIHKLPLDCRNNYLQFLVFGRLIKSILLGCSVFFINKAKLARTVFLSSFFFIAVLILLIAKTDIIPDFYTDNMGVSGFGKIMENVMFILQIIVLAGFIKNREKFNSEYLLYVIVSLVLSIVTNVIIMLNLLKPQIYSTVPVMVQICSVSMFYRALMSIDKQLFNQWRNVKINEQTLRKKRSELEIRIAQRNQELEKVNNELRMEIEKRKFHEEALRKSEERFKAVLKNMKIRVGHCDSQLRYTWLYNPFECFSKDIAMMTEEELSSEQWASDIMELKNEVVNRGVGKQKEIRVKQGPETRVFSFIAEPLFEGERIAGVTTVSFDVTEKKRIEKNLEQRHRAIESIYTIATTLSISKEQMYEKIASEISSILNVPMIKISKLINGQLRVITSYSNGVFQSSENRSMDCYSCRSFQSTKQDNQKVEVTNEPVTETFCFSEYQPIANLGVPVRNSTGEIIGLICIFDKVMRSFSKEQVHMVEIFSRYIANEIEKEAMVVELLQAKEMALLGQLTSGVAHEVRNPLNAIWAITEALFLELEDKQDMIVYKEHIKNQVERLGRLMRDLLDLGRSNVRSERNDFTLKRLCEETIHVWVQDSPEKKSSVVLENDSNSENIIINGDSAKIQQILVNLLDNAFEHSPQNTPISLITKIDSGCWIDLSVVDRGCGIDLKIIDRIFEPFFTTRKRGTGLGLSIVRHIVELHKGTIEISNNEQEAGVTAKIRMPLQKRNVSIDEVKKDEYEFFTLQ